MSNKYKDITNFLYEVGTLRKLVRSHRQTLLFDDLSDNIASHSYRVIVIGYFLSKLEKADTSKVLLMCTLHDIPETRSGDQNWVHKKYVKAYENEIINDQLSPLPFNKDLKIILDEYNERKTTESIIAKDADLIDQILILKEHSATGNETAKKWLDGAIQLKLIKTHNAKKLGEQIYSIDPDEWHDNVWTYRNR